MSNELSTEPVLKQWAVKYRPRSLNEMILPSTFKARVKTLIAKKDAHAILITGRELSRLYRRLIVVSQAAIFAGTSRLA